MIRTVAAALLTLLCAHLAGLAGASGQWLGHDMPDSDACPIGDFRAKLIEVDALCCSGPGGCAGGSVTPSPRCGGKFISLYAACNRTMTQLLDGMDGATDGTAHTVEDLRRACLALPADQIIDEMIRMRDEDNCTISGNGVGEQAVQAAAGGCVDVDATLCGLVTQGVLSCKDDFCADCQNAHKCDSTCALDCSTAGSASGSGKGGKGGHRRAQIHISDGCTALTLEAKVTPVNSACCDAGRESTCQGGGSGVPTVCDVQCAMAYTPFFGQCERALRLSFDAQTMAAFSGLASTCDTLSADPLLRTLGAASCPPVAPTPAAAVTSGFGSWLDGELDCSLAQLKTAAAAVDKACCADGGCVGGQAPGACSPECGGKLLGMFATCSTTLDLVFDGLGDGVYDGTALTLSRVRDSCLALPAGDVVAAIKLKQEAGCTLEVEGVGETAVHENGGGSCTDTGPAGLCQMVGQGLLHCVDDFCPDCAHAASCDLTCGFCPETPPADGGKGKGRRRNQIVVDGGAACSPTAFEQRTNDVNDACCDDGADTKCSGGVPTSCDARCALTYNPYFGECQHLITAVMDPAQLVTFQRLADACSALPTADLLTALASANCNPIPACDAAAQCHASELPVPPHGRWHVSDDCRTASLVCDDGFEQSHDAPSPPPPPPFGAPPPPPPMNPDAACQTTGGTIGSPVYSWVVPECCRACRAPDPTLACGGTETNPQVMAAITQCHGCALTPTDGQAVVFGCIDFWTAQCEYVAGSGSSFDDALAQFATCAEASPPAGYCHGSLTSAAMLRNQDVCKGASSTNVAFHIRIPFHTTMGGEYTFRLHADYGLGSFIGVDAATHTPGNTWGHVQTDPAMLLTGDTTDDDHEFEALGFEDCCDGHAELEVHLPCDRATDPWRIVQAGVTACMACDTASGPPPPPPTNPFGQVTPPPPPGVSSLPASCSSGG